MVLMQNCCGILAGAISIIRPTASIQYQKEFYANDNLGQYYAMATLQLGNQQFQKIKFYLKEYDLPFDGFIGSTFLKNRRKRSKDRYILKANQF